MKRSPIKRTTPVKRANKARKAAAFERAYGSPDRAEWFRAQPCLICEAIPSENAHVPSKSGASRKGDAKHVVPLCAWDHRTGEHSLHALNKEGFNTFWCMDLDAIAAQYDAAYTAHQNTPPETP